jgi:hypothetical protein
VISLNLVLAGLRLGLRNRQVGEKWVADDCSYLCKGPRIAISVVIPPTIVNTGLLKKVTISSIIKMQVLFINIKKTSTPLIIYSPQGTDKINQDSLEKINNEPNSVIVNFRGRLLNDIFTSVITTSYDKK